MTGLRIGKPTEPYMTLREAEAFGLYMTGMQLDEVARQMGTTLQTVKNLISGLYHKIDATNCRDAAYKLGWVVVPPEARSTAATGGTE